MVRRLLAPTLAFALVTAWLVLLAPPADAACHIARFIESDVEVDESAGMVSLVVELQGRVGSCAGTVDVATVDGTAVAGEDYEPVTQTLVFEENDDRVETVDITILADDQDDSRKSFTVELSNPTGGITGTGSPATVTITDGDAEAQDDAPTEPATADDDATGDAQDDVTDDTDESDEDGGRLGIIIAVVAAMVIGIGAVALLRGRA